MTYITIRDVAQRAGISVSTVSRALNNNGRISLNTKAKVERAVAELGYIPDSRAQAMRSSRTKTVGLLVPDIRNAYFAELAYTVQDSLFDAGYCAFIGTSSESAARQDSFLASILSQRIDGAIIVPQGEVTEALEKLIEQHLPLMFMDRHVEPQSGGLENVPVVDSDPTNGICDALKDIKRHGFLSVGYISGPIVASPSLQEREQVFRNVASKMFGENNVFVESTGFDQSSCANVVNRMRNSGVKALIVGYSPDALRVMNVMAREGLVIGKDMSLISFDDVEVFRLATPHISVISQQVQIIGRTSAELFLDMLENNSEVKSHRVETVYIPRESLGNA
ncbi:LacI family DNA-binding transcriptional regulator [Gardnerella sp. DNF00502]|uniref:LacI family DNA-binding transcriptional regulator n=1 Tax=unclassified Gardnerella TaxID=2628112 RepID=UPI000C9EE676|nr:LacI family DNA-binding transcriptional regulator [Gardnerella sp. KA00735]PNP89547.1 LacI family transcriptional regulator [Gardnerella sp. KA00735]